MRNTPLKAFATPLKHELKDKKEHAHSEGTNRGLYQSFITVDGERGETTTGHATGHSSTQGSYIDIAKKHDRHTTPKYTGDPD